MPIAFQKSSTATPKEVNIQVIHQELRPDKERLIVISLCGVSVPDEQQLANELAFKFGCSVNITSYSGVLISRIWFKGWWDKFKEWRRGIK